MQRVQHSNLIGLIVDETVAYAFWLELYAIPCYLASKGTYKGTYTRTIVEVADSVCAFISCK